MYNEQIEDIVDRNVARKLSNKEIESYSGVVHYMSHHRFWNQTPYLLHVALFLMLQQYFRASVLMITGQKALTYSTIYLEFSFDIEKTVLQWPLQQRNLAVEVPEQVKSVLDITKEIKENLAKRIDISQFSSYQRLLRVAATVLFMYNKSSKASFKNVCK